MTYTPFMVAPLGTGVSKYLKPWLQPEDAFQDMQDCFQYRGQIQKRYGYNLYGVFPNKVGIKHVGIGDGVTTTFTPTLDYVPVGKRSLAITHTNGSTVVTDGIDDGAGNITGTNIAAGSTINYATGAITLNFTAAPTINTPIRINYGVKVASNTGGAPSPGPYTLNFPTTGAFGTPLTLKSIFIKNTASNQFSATSGDVPTSTTTGTLVNGSGISSGSITDYTAASNQGTVTFVGNISNVAANADIWATWEYTAPANPIKGIKFFWASDGSQNTIVFNNNQMAQLDPANFKINNVSGADIWTTADANFFSVANYQNKAWILNNTNRLTAYDGTNIFQPIVSFTRASPTVNELTTGLHIFIYKNRLVVLRPTESGTVKPQRARFSALNNPLDWISDTRGHGGFIDAPTPEWIVGAEFLRDELIVYFQDSTWKLRYTAVDTAPFRWEKINDTRRVDAPYSAVSYQNFTTAVGSTGLIRCDGVNVERYDDKVIDFTEDNIDQDTIGIVNSFRFDQQNQQFLCYQSSTGNGGSLTTNYSDQWLIWNFLENSFATWNINATCFGAYFQGRDLAWEDFTAINNMDWSWSDVNLGDATWLSFFSQGQTRIPMFGSKTGQLFSIYPSFTTDNGTKTGFEFTTKDYNPFVKEGKQCRLGYVDFYFDRPDGENDDDADYLLSIDFYTNENEVPFRTVTLNPAQDNWVKKRVHVNAIANFHRFRVYLSDDQITTSTVATKGFNLNGFILYMQPAGRITN